MLTNHSNKRFCLSLGEVATILICWHTLDNRATRDADGSYTHYLDQINGGYMKHVKELISLLHNSMSLERAGFAVTDSDIELVQEDVIGEDNFADFHFMAIMTQAGCRMRRNLHLLKGFPWLLTLMNIPDRAAGVLDRFKKVIDNYNYIDSLTEANTKKCQEVMERHVSLNTTNIQQKEVA